MVLVTGYKKDEVKKYVISKIMRGDFIFCEQKERLGTGHAVKASSSILARHRQNPDSLCRRSL